MYLNKGQCGHGYGYWSPWWAYEYWSDSKECQVPIWNGTELWKAEQEQAEAAASGMVSATVSGADDDDDGPLSETAVA